MSRIQLIMTSVMTLILLSDGGTNAQWTQQTSGTTVRLSDVVMLDSLAAICVGDSGKILKTTNAGITWQTKHGGRQQWNGVAFANHNIGIVVGNQSARATTTDGGDSWSTPSSTGPANLLSVAYIGMSSLFIGTDSGMVLYSHDGIVWQTVRFGQEPINSIFGGRGDFLPVNMFVLTPRIAYKSSDLGATWAAQPLPITIWGSALRGSLAPGGTAHVVGFDGNPGPYPTLLRRSPSDTAWTKFLFMPPVLPRVVHDVSTPSGQVAFACGSLGSMFKTNDGGSFWSYHNSGTTRNLRAIHFLNERRGFAVGDSGTIMFTANGGMPSTNRPPLPFHLILPPDRDTMTEMRSINFVWRRAPDPDGDSVRYVLTLSSNGGSTWQTLGITSDTSLQVHAFWSQGVYLWTVTATDGILTTPSLDVFTFTIRRPADVEKEETPIAFALYQNYPNPVPVGRQAFNPITTITYIIGHRTSVSLKVFDVLGREVATPVNEVQGSGFKTIKFNAGDLSSGVYYYQLQTEGFAATKRMFVIR